MVIHGGRHKVRVPHSTNTKYLTIFPCSFSCRLAQELELDKMPTGTDERQNFNRIRTWLNCFSVDKSHAAQFGKMHMVSLDDQVVRNTVRVWYNTSPSVNAPYDIGLCAYADMLLLLAKFRDDVGFGDDLNQKYLEVSMPSRCCFMCPSIDTCCQGFDVVTHAINFDKDFDQLSTVWSASLHGDPNYDFCQSMYSCMTWHLSANIIKIGPIVRYRTHNFTLYVPSCSSEDSL